MSFLSICLRRPVFATVLSLILIIVGVLGYLQLTVRFQPEVFHPHLEIVTSYAGANAAQVEQNITTPLEQALSGTPNLTLMTSQSNQGVSEISLSFKSISQQNFVIAQSQVLQELGAVKLPSQAETPRVFSRNSNARLMDIAFVDPKISSVEMANFINNQVLNALNKIQGTADIRSSDPPSALRIDLDPVKMAQNHIDLTELTQVLNQNNAAFSVGEITSEDQTIPLNAVFQLNSLPAFQNLVIQSTPTGQVRLKDIARVYVGSETRTGRMTRVDGQPGVVVMISNTDEANPIDVGRHVRAVLAHMAKTMPPGMQYHVVFDISEPLLHSIQDVVWTLFESIALVAIITLLCLASLRAIWIPLVTIPVCLLGALGLMYLMGFTLNTMTLLALVLAVGLVVDDAIVVLENHHRHLEAGMKPGPAAHKNLSEIQLAILGMTLALIAVYLPAGFLQKNTTGIYYLEFAYTLAAAVGISGFVALTLSPMMCRYLLGVHLHRGRYARAVDRLFERTRQGYRRLLKLILVQKRWIVLIFVTVIGLGVIVIRKLPTELLPSNAASMVMMFMGVPDSASVSYTEKTGTPFVEALSKDPIVAHTISFAGGNFLPSNNMITFFRLSVPGTSEAANAFVKKINQELNRLPGVSGGAMIYDLNNSDHSMQGGSTFYISGAVSYAQLEVSLIRLLNVLGQYPGIQITDNSLSGRSTEYDISVNRLLANQLQVPMSSIVMALQVNYGGYQLENDYQYGGVGYQVILQLSRAQMTDFKALSQIYVSSVSGDLIPLSRLLRVDPVAELGSRTHMNQLRAGEVDYNVMPGYTAGQVMAAIQQAGSEVLAPGMTLGFEGNALRMQQEAWNMNLIMILGVIFIYLILAALFESFRDPWMILLTVPVCVVGALVALYVSGGALNLYTMIGLVTLIGLVSKHGVLITQFTHQLREKGMSKTDALIEAASIRLRPILMTTATMVLGALPLVFARGQGALGQHEIGLVIVSGLLVGTFFSLFVVPVAYQLFAKKDGSSQ